MGEALSYGPFELLDSVRLSFADITPAEHQDRWDEPISPWDLLPADLVMWAEDGKKLWSLLLRKRDPPAGAWVFADGGDRRALSAALAVCDSLGLGRDKTIFLLADPDGGLKERKPANQHVYDVVKLSRHSVVG